jgi:SAM-dependent methyltransferase
MQTYLVKRKYTTALYGCPRCKLSFRIPKDDPHSAEAFYDSEYRQGFTTTCPSSQTLEDLKRTSFAGTERDYLAYISLLRAAGVVPGMSVFDFGCSWGYGSWQMTQAGFEVYSYEIGRIRARYAEQKLGCKMVAPANLDRQVDCFFSAHVLEHLNDPNQMWATAHRVLKPTGVAIVALPNGSLSQPNVHSIWGKVHPLLIDSEALQIMARSAGFCGCTYTSPYDLDGISRSVQPAQLSGSELVIVARK